MALNLAAPHTWCAAIMPALFAFALSLHTTGYLPFLTCLVLLIICILMQSAVNALNDYFDFKEGADTEADEVDEDDSVLVYNDIDPKSVLAFALLCLAAAFLLGIHIIAIAGYIPLLIALLAALIVLLYSGGRTPISHLPIGEAVSGITMGGLIPLAIFCVLTGDLDWFVLLLSIPEIIGVGLIMMTNNTCDIEKDREARRATLPTKLQREGSIRVYRCLLVLWDVSIVVIVGVCFSGGIIFAICMLLAQHPVYKALQNNPLIPRTRRAAMAQICSLNIILGAFYALSISGSYAGFTLLW